MSGWRSAAHDLAVLVAIGLLHGPLVDLAGSLGLDRSPWPASPALGGLLCGAAALHAVGIVCKAPSSLARLGARAASAPDGWWAALMREHDMLVLTPLLLGQLVLWFFLVATGVGFLIPGAAWLGVLAGLATAGFISWATWRAIRVGAGEIPPPTGRAGRLEAVGDVLLAASAAVVVVPWLGVLSGSLGDSGGASGLALGALLGVAFYGAPRLPSLVEDLGNGRAMLRVALTLVLAVLGA